MRPWLRFLLVSLALGAFLLLVRYVTAAQSMPPPFGPPRLGAIAAQPVLDMNGTLVAFVVRAKIEAIQAHPSGLIDASELGSVEVDLMKTNGTVVIDGVAVDDREAVDQLMAILMREWQKTNPSPLPQRRRAMRVK